MQVILLRRMFPVPVPRQPQHAFKFTPNFSTSAQVRPPRLHLSHDGITRANIPMQPGQ